MGDGSAQRSEQPLFRPEVARRRSNEWLAEVQVSQPVPLRLPLAVGLFCVVCGLIFAFVFSYAARIPVVGELVPIGGVIEVKADISAIVSEMRVTDGSRVVAGQVIAVLHAPLEIAGGSSIQIIENELHSREGRLSTRLARLDETEARIRRDAASEISHLENELTALEQEEAINSRKKVLARDAVDRIQFLRDRGLISSLEVSRYEGELLAVEASELSRQRGVIAARRQLDSASRTREDRLADVEDQRTQIHQELSGIRQALAEMHARAERVIRAPIDGRVTARLVDIGQAVAIGTALATVTPDGADLEAVLDVPSQAIASLSEGSQVMLRIEAYPYQRFGLLPAIVTGVSGSTIPGNAERTTYRVRARLESQHVVLEDAAHPLLPGMRVDAQILLDHGSRGTGWFATVRHHLTEMLGK